MKESHPCRKEYSDLFAWCVHEACRPQGRISEEIKRMDGSGRPAASEPDGYQTLGDAQDALIDLLQQRSRVEESVTLTRARVEETQRELSLKEATLQELGNETKRALAVVAMGFHMTVKDNNA